MSAIFDAGESCLLVDSKGRHYLVTLQPGTTFHYHGGTVAHDALVGAAPGASINASTGARLVALRPRLADYILAMPRGAQVVYPKDIGQIVMWGDIGPGMTVLEAGTGSGALAMALARAVGPAGKVVSVERRPDHAAHAAKTIAAFFGGVPDQLDLRVGEVSEAAAEVQPDRIVLDIPEPWTMVTPAAEHLALGGTFTAYLPTVPQIQQLRESLRNSGVFAERVSFETLHREWAAEGRSVRPAHQMVGHTGFITVARRVMSG